MLGQRAELFPDPACSLAQLFRGQSVEGFKAVLIVVFRQSKSEQLGTAFRLL